MPALDDPFGDGLVYEASLPLHWRMADEAPSPADEAERRARNERNDDLLRILSIVDQSGIERNEEKPDFHQELLRLETKLDLILELVGEVASKELGVPPRVPVKLSARGMAWRTDSPPPLNARVILSLYLQPGLPRPIVIAARVIAVDGNVVSTVFEGTSEAVEDGIDKLIFRHHRRAIAQARHHDTT